MRNKLYILVLLLAVGCHKDPPTLQTCLIQSVYVGSYTKATYTYDAQNRLSVITNPFPNNRYMTSTLHYGSNGLVDKVEYSGSAGTLDHLDYYYNFLGQIIVDSIYENGSSFASDYDIYLYNTSGEMVEQYGYEDTSSTTAMPSYMISAHYIYTYNENGNITEMKLYDFLYSYNKVDTTNFVQKCTYDNSPNINSNLMNEGLFFLMLNKNNIVTIEDSARKLMQLNTYTYNLNNYPTKQVSVNYSSGGNDTITTTYSYLCH